MLPRLLDLAAAGPEAGKAGRGAQLPRLRVGATWMSAGCYEFCFQRRAVRSKDVHTGNDPRVWAGTAGFSSAYSGAADSTLGQSMPSSAQIIQKLASTMKWLFVVPITIGAIVVVAVLGFSVYNPDRAVSFWVFRIGPNQNSAFNICKERQAGAVAKLRDIDAAMVRIDERMTSKQAAVEKLRAAYLNNNIGGRDSGGGPDNHQSGQPGVGFLGSNDGDILQPETPARGAETPARGAEAPAREAEPAARAPGSSYYLPDDMRELNDLQQKKSILYNQKLMFYDQIDKIGQNCFRAAER